MTMTWKKIQIKENIRTVDWEILILGLVLIGLGAISIPYMVSISTPSLADNPNPLGHVMSVTSSFMVLVFGLTAVSTAFDTKEQTREISIDIDDKENEETEE